MRPACIAQLIQVELLQRRLKPGSNSGLLPLKKLEPPSFFKCPQPCHIHDPSCHLSIHCIYNGPYFTSAVFPPLNANNNPPSPASVSPSGIPPNGTVAAVPGTMPNSEPRKVRTFSVHGDQSDTAPAAPVAAAPATVPAKPTGITRQIPPPAARAPAGGSGPLSLAPDSAQAAMPPPRQGAVAPQRCAAPVCSARRGRAAPFSGSRR